MLQQLVAQYDAWAARVGVKPWPGVLRAQR
jgi:hypothetical protein